MRIVTLRRFLFAITASLLLIVGIGVDAFAQSRGAGGRAAGAGGGVSPSSAGGSRREVIVGPQRQGSPTDNFPWPARRDRGINDVERTPRDEQESARKDRDERLREERRQQEDQTRREETARRETARRQDHEANRFQKLARWLEVSPERLQNFYLEAKQANPNLRLSQFFAAFVIANRLNGSNSNVTPQAILRGLDSGMSLERTLTALGLSTEEVKATINWAERVVNHLKP